MKFGVLISSVSAPCGKKAKKRLRLDPGTGPVFGTVWYCWVMIPEFSRTPTDNGDVAHEGAMDVAEALVGLEVPGVEPGHGGGARTGGSRGKGLRGGHA